MVPRAITVSTALRTAFLTPVTASTRAIVAPPSPSRPILSHVAGTLIAYKSGNYYRVPSASLMAAIVEHISEFCPLTSAEKHILLAKDS